MNTYRFDRHWSVPVCLIGTNGRKSINDLQYLHGLIGFYWYVVITPVQQEIVDCNLLTFQTLSTVMLLVCYE